MSDEQSPFGFSFAMLSSLGRVRQGNEDFCTASPETGLFTVCDGMGGAAAGEVASRLAATTFAQHVAAALPLAGVAEGLLAAAVHAANSAVYKLAQEAPSMRGMGTTLVALLVQTLPQQGRCLWVAHVGDSRCYRLRQGVLTQLTEDHSLVQEQVRAGQMTLEEADSSPMRNIITRSVGSSPRVEPEVRALDPLPGDLYLLASDGLTRELSDEELVEHLDDHDGALEEVCEALVGAANAAGGNDNITVLLLRLD
jgi:serine/threonine protein phosphatase PrpC